jgi:LacI family transcriptional regulator
MAIKPRAKYTMRDVARLAGVSTSTVSAVINGSVPVSSARAEKVRAAMTALDYHPDEVARSLKTGRTNVVGVIVPDITNAFYPEVVRGVEEAAGKAGYSVLLCDSSEDARTEEKHLNTLFARRVDGVLLACCAHSTAYDTMVRRRFPMVFVDRVPAAAPEGTIATDNVGSGAMAARHLIALGHERIAMLAGNLELSPHRDRLEGFRKAMQETNLPIRDEYLISGGVQVQDGDDAGVQLLALHPRPTAIMVSNNQLFLGLLQALERRQVRIPEEVSVVGFDDHVWNAHFHPSLTAVAQATFEMGRRGFELLQRIMGRKPGEELPEKHVRLEAELRVRNSTGKAG